MPDKDTIRLISQSRGASKRDLQGKVNYIEVWTNNGEDTIAEVYESTGNITQIIHFMDINGEEFSCIGYINDNNDNTYNLELERFGSGEEGKGRYVGWDIAESAKIKDVLKDSWDNPYFKPYILREEVSNPNLLINADFKVNQRGQTTYNSPNYYYTVDHWSIWDSSTTSDHCSLEVHNNYIKYIGAAETPVDLENCLYQSFEPIDIKKIIGKKVTISCYIKSLQGEAHFKGNFGINHWMRSENLQEGFNSYTFEVADIDPSHGRGLIGIQLMRNAIVEVYWMKLEVGEFATKFVPVTYGEDLSKCQRYYVKINYSGIPIVGFRNSTTNICGLFTLPQNLKEGTVDTIKISYSTGFSCHHSVANYLTPTGCSLAGVSGNLAVINFNTGSRDDGWGPWIITTGGWVSFESEL